MKKVFVDSDIILDLLAKRDPNYIYAAELFTLIDQQKIIGFTSPIVFANLHYLLRKNTSNLFALKSLRKLKTLIKILPVDEKVIEQSLNSEFTDFEDAIQYFTAVNNGISIILTRNKVDYKKSKILIATAEEYLKGLQ
ncbi:MAG: PIN domain-containing protein [Ignavibacteriaceae bacterium]|nr:PIN domain-containing protein [Ignavibacterium sp.]MCC6255583.1 PIN domain-containing protein [Ignavibacteriaceae bacterium]HRN28042.1 PIN domain-containing protein [Ignavibacteriaceae bacterium]HRQ55707.1 PIN domain-containing protein [Ignavibacteriaceae bacterium]